MSSSTDSPDAPAAAQIHENARAVLLYIAEAEDETASTTDIKDATGLSAANISGYHAKNLIEYGWIEKSGSVESRAPNDPNLYTLTHRGRKEAKQLLKQEPAPMTEKERTLMVRNLQDRVEELEEALENERSPESGSINDEINELRQEVERHSRALKNIRDRIKQIYSYIEDQ